MIASILKQHAGAENVLATEGTLNNDIGVPLTLLSLAPRHQFAVIEMGTNHFGEIAYLTHIAKPTVTLITNAGPSHLEGLGDVEGVSRAKGEIFRGLAADGTAIINADDYYADYWSELVLPRKIIRFGGVKGAEVSAKNIGFNESGKAHFSLQTPAGEILVQLPILGAHNIANALAKLPRLLLPVGAPLESIKAGLEQLPSVSKRLNEYVCHGARVIDDTYNANPLSVKAALEILASQTGEKILVLGDMRELGSAASDRINNELAAMKRGVWAFATSLPIW